MKTLANCSSTEFFAQIPVITRKLKPFKDKIKEVKDNAGDSEPDLFEIIQIVFEDNTDSAMDICGALCFMDGKQFAELSDGITEVIKVINNERVLAFFLTLFKLNPLLIKH